MSKYDYVQVVIPFDDMYLLQKMESGSPWPNKLSPLGTRMHDGEDPFEAAIRVLAMRMKYTSVRPDYRFLGTHKRPNKGETFYYVLLEKHKIMPGKHVGTKVMRPVVLVPGTPDTPQYINTGIDFRKWLTGGDDVVEAAATGQDRDSVREEVPTPEGTVGPVEGKGARAGRKGRKG